MKKSLVMGAGGQDGSILSEELSAAGREVRGLGRKKAYPYESPSPHFRYAALDLTDTAALARCLEEFQPDEIYHLAAVHGSAGFEYEQVWGQALDVNVKSFHTALEYARRRPDVRLFYASSAKIFGHVLRGPVSLSTPRAGECLYSITKKAAGGLADHYRRNHGVATAVGILFNHESERRAPGYFIPRLCRILRTALDDPSHREKVQTLSFHCDWSSARDFMRMAIAALDQSVNGELIFASGVTWSGRAFARELFSRYGLDYTQHVEADDRVEGESFLVDLNETRSAMNFAMCEDIFDVCAALINMPGAARQN
jgi:GDPmannose 4,6-dehydratase